MQKKESHGMPFVVQVYYYGKTPTDMNNWLWHFPKTGIHISVTYIRPAP